MSLKTLDPRGLRWACCRQGWMELWALILMLGLVLLLVLRSGLSRQPACLSDTWSQLKANDFVFNFGGEVSSSVLFPGCDVAVVWSSAVSASPRPESLIPTPCTLSSVLLHELVTDGIMLASDPRSGKVSSSCCQSYCLQFSENHVM